MARPTILRCYNCGKKFRVRNPDAERIYDCPHCNSPLLEPGLSGESSISSLVTDVPSGSMAAVPAEDADDPFAFVEETEPFDPGEHAASVEALPAGGGGDPFDDVTLSMEDVRPSPPLAVEQPVPDDDDDRAAADAYGSRTLVPEVSPPGGPALTDSFRDPSGGFATLVPRSAEVPVTDDSGETKILLPGKPVDEAGIAPVEVEEDGRFIGPYRIDRKIGEGGMGVVYKGMDSELNRPVAVKVLKSVAGLDEQVLERFRQEANAIAQLKHPSIVKVYRIGRHRGMPYFVMDFIEGQSLSEMIGKAKLSLRKKVHLVIQLAQALDYAHKNKVIHRDIKPGNVIVTEDGKPVITDFGLAKKRDEGKIANGGITQEGMAIGTPFYMPPEQLEGKIDQIDGNSDLYSLGVLLYELLTGKVPFEAANALALFHKVMSEQPKFPVRLAKSVPQRLREICLKAIRKEKRQRYQSGGELARDLKKFLADWGEKTTRQTAARPEVSVRRKGLVLAVGGTLTVVAGFLLLLGPPGSGQRKTRRITRTEKTAAGDDQPSGASRERILEATRHYAAVRTLVRTKQLRNALVALEEAFRLGGEDPDFLRKLERLCERPDVLHPLVDFGFDATLAFLGRVFPDRTRRVWVRLAEHFRGRGEAAFVKKQYEEANRHASRVLSIAAEDLASRKLLGDVMRAQGDFGGAINHYRQLLTTPRRDQVYLGVAWCYYHVQHHEFARKYLALHLRDHPAEVEGRMLRGMLRAADGKKDMALDDFRFVAGKAPPGDRSYDPVFRLLGDLYLQRRQYGEAVRHYALYSQRQHGSATYAWKAQQEVLEASVERLRLASPRIGASGLPYRCDFRRALLATNMPLYPMVAIHVPDDLDRLDGPWHLKLFRRKQSTVKFVFSLERVPAKVWLLVRHATEVSAASGGRRYTPITIRLNERDVVADEDVSTGVENRVRRWDVTRLLLRGENVLEWVLGMKVTSYRLRSVEIAPG